jgi:hypothetical protein
MAAARLSLSTILNSLFFVLSSASVVHAELPSIRLDRLQPLGAAVGTSVEVDVSGRDIDDVSALRFDQPGLTAELVKPNRFKISVAAEAPEGTYDVRLVGRFGVSNPRQFAVNRGLTDVAEREPNNNPAEAQTVAFNSAINGVSDGNDHDVFRFAAKKGERIVIDCQAQKLDSPLDANLALFGSDGQLLASNGDYHGRDPFLDFVAPADGEYLVLIHDLSYRGGFPYRLMVTNRPHVENVFPRAVQPGATVELTAFGRNFGDGSKPATNGAGPASSAAGEPPLDAVRFPFTVGPELSSPGRFIFREHPSDHSVLPTAATCTLDGFQVVVPVGGGAIRPVNMVLAESAVTIETEPNDDKQHALVVSIPATVSGRFDKPRDADWFEVTASAAGQHVIEVFCERIAGRADPYVVVVDDKENAVTEFDDFGIRMNAFDGHLRDPVGTVNFEANRKYRVLVQDRYSRGGPQFQYVLAIRKPAPDFHVAAIHSENPGPSGTTVWRGGAAFLDLIIHQRDGFNEPITITAEGLPPGLHAQPTVVNNNSQGKFVLWADADAAEWSGAIRLVATGKQGENLLTREVRPYTRVWSEANIGSSRPTRELAIGLRDKAPYQLKIVPEQITVESGKPAELKLVATRLWPEFQDKISVTPLAFPGSFQLGAFDLPADKTELPLKIMVQNGTRPGPYTLTVLGQAQVPYHKEAKADSKPKTLVSSPSLPVTITVVMPAGKQ